MNRDQLLKQMEQANVQKKQSSDLTSYVSYLLIGVIGIWLYQFLFGNPNGREIEI